MWLEKKVHLTSPTSDISICFHANIKNMYGEPSFFYDINKEMGGGFTRKQVFTFGSNRTYFVDQNLPFNIWIHLCFVNGANSGFYYEGNEYFEVTDQSINDVQFKEDVLISFGISDKLFSQDRLITPKMRFTLPQIFTHGITPEEAQSFITCGSKNKPRSENSETRWTLRTTNSPDILSLSQPELKLQNGSQSTTSNGVPCEVVKGESDLPVFVDIFAKINPISEVVKNKNGEPSLPPLKDLFETVIGGIEKPEAKMNNKVNLSTLETQSTLDVMGVFTLNVTSISDICAPVNGTKLILIPSGFAFKRQRQICKDIGGSLFNYSEEEFPRVRKLVERLQLFSIYVYVQPKTEGSCLVMWYAVSSPGASLFKTDCGLFHDGLLLCDVPVISTVRMKYFWDDGLLPPPRKRIFTDNVFFIVEGKRENLFVSRFGDIIRHSRNTLYLNCSRGKSYEAVAKGADIFGRFNWKQVGATRDGDIGPSVLLTLCTDEQFTCNFGQCIPLTKRCDGTKDCDDGSDEQCDILLNDNSKASKPPLKSTPISMTLEFKMVEEVLAVENLVKTRLVTEIVWHDPRVNFSQLSDTPGNNELPEGTPIWRPLFNLPNVNLKNVLDYKKGKLSHYFAYGIKLKNVSASINEGVEAYIYNAGESAQIGLREEFLADYYCPMDLLLFPFDVHQCSIQISIRNSGSFLVYFNLKNVTQISHERTITLFDVSGLMMQVIEMRDGQPTTLGFNFLLKRRFGSFILTNVIPCLLIGLVGTMTYFFDDDNFQDRIMVTLSCLIVLASLFSQLSSSQPQSASSKAIEIVFFYYICKLSLIFMTHTLSSMISRREPKLAFDLYDKANYHSPLRSVKSSSTVNPYLNKIKKTRKQRFCTVRVMHLASISISIVSDIVFISGFSLFIVITRKNIFTNFFDKSGNIYYH